MTSSPADCLATLCLSLDHEQLPSQSYSVTVNHTCWETSTPAIKKPLDVWTFDRKSKYPPTRLP